MALSRKLFSGPYHVVLLANYWAVGVISTVMPS